MAKFDKFLSKTKEDGWGTTGWITDKGTVLLVPPYDHVNFAYDHIKGKGGYKNLKKWFEKHLKDLRESHDASARMYKEEGGGWHYYEMEWDNFTWEARSKLLNYGWVRIYFEKPASILTVHGRAKGLKEHYERTQSLKEALEREYWESCPDITVKYEKERE